MILHLKEEFISKINFDKFEVVNKEIISFFESVPHLNEEILVRIAKLIIKYAEMIIDKRKNVKEDEKRFVAYKLFEYRNKFYAFYNNIKNTCTKKEKENCV